MEEDEVITSTVGFKCEKCGKSVPQADVVPCETSARFICKTCVPSKAPLVPRSERTPAPYARPECSLGRCKYPERCQRDNACQLPSG